MPEAIEKNQELQTISPLDKAKHIVNRAREKVPFIRKVAIKASLGLALMAAACTPTGPDFIPQPLPIEAPTIPGKPHPIDTHG